MSERKKYNWRTHEWKAGDRCVVRYKDGSGGPATIKAIYADGYSFEVLLDTMSTVTLRAHTAECIPLRKKERPKLREFWVTVPPGEVPNNDNILVFPSEKDVAEYNDGNDIPEDVIHVREVREPKERAK